jgi:hypothetical protein
MSQPEESRRKTNETDDVLLRQPGRNARQRAAQAPARPPGERGMTRVERGGELRPLDWPEVGGAG